MKPLGVPAGLWGSGPLNTSLIVIVLVGLSALWSVSPIAIRAQEAEIPPMVAKKIFEPLTATPQPGPAVQGPRPGDALIVTGIVMAPSEKKALIVEKTSPKSSGKPTSGPWYREGDAVAGYTVEKIDAGSVFLAAGEQKMSVPLFGTVKERPQPMMAPRVPSSAGAAGRVRGGAQDAESRGHQGAPGASLPDKTGTQGSQTPSATGAAAGSAAPIETAPAEGVSSGSFPNPFLEALKKARQQQAPESVSPPIPGHESQ